ncbi:unnamed protein product, partial [Vitis vinifera]
MASPTPPHCSITAAKPYQNLHYPQNPTKNHHNNHHWSSHKVSLTNPLPSPRNAAKPGAASPATATNRNSNFPSLSPLPPSKSELTADFSGRRSTRFVSKMHFGRPKTAAAARHTSTAEEALRHAIRFASDDKGIDSVLLNFESRLCGSDDYTFLLRELGNRGDSGLKPNLVTYNAVIDACGKGGVDFNRAAEIFDEMNLFSEMLYRGIEQDIFTYNTLLDAVCKGGQMDLAFQIMSEMPRKHIMPNVVTYSTVIDGYAKAGRLDEALNLFNEMKFASIGLDRVSYNTLLSIYAKLGRFEEALNVCKEMESSGIKKDAVTYNALLGGYGKQGKYEEVKRVFEEMKAERIFPNLLTYSTLIDVYSKGGLYQEAMEVFREFKKAGLKADVVLYSALIDALCKNGLVESAVSFLDEMTKEGIRPNVVTYNSIIDAFGRSGIVEDATESEVGDKEDNQIIKIFGQLAAEKTCHAKKENRGRQEILCILAVFHKMHELDIKPNVVTFSAILNACSRCNSFEDASMLLEELRLFDNQVYGVAHGLLMGYGDNVWVQAQSLFDEVKQMDSSTASAFYNALTDMLWHFGQRRGAQLVVLEGKRRHVWENMWSNSCLDLHLMSSGAARAMVHAWLLNIRSIVFEGHELPQLLSILTGWGKHSKVVGDGALRRAIEALLTGMGAPFRVAKCNLGRFISTGAVVAAWLRESGTLKVLVLHDDRTNPDRARCSQISNLQTLPL